MTKRGRKFLSKEKSIRVSAVLPESLRDLARVIGDGEVSRGIRLALQYWQNNRPLLRPSQWSQAIETDGFLANLEKEKAG